MRVGSKFRLIFVTVIALTLVVIGRMATFKEVFRMHTLDKTKSVFKTARKEQISFTDTLHVTKSNYLTSGHHCKMVVPKLSKTPLPVTGLLSFPGAGNTWVRHLIQQATGLATASLYCDKTLQSHGFPFECHSDYTKVVAVKSHGSAIRPRQKVLETFPRVILILRDPVNTLLAFFNYENAAQRRTAHTGEAPLSSYAKKWSRYFPRKLNDWKKFHQKWLCDFSGPLHPILYEDLQKDPYTELKRLFEFLHLEVKESSLVCAVQNQEGNFHRNKTTSKSINSTFNYTESLLANITEISEHVAKCLYAKYGVVWSYFPNKT